MTKRNEPKVTRRGTSESFPIDPDQKIDPPRKGGVVRKYDRALLVPEICARLGKGDRPLNVILDDMQINVWAVTSWRRDDPTIARAIDQAFELGMDRTRMKILPTLQGKKEEEGGLSTGNVERDKRIQNHLEWLLERADNRYNKSVKLANDPVNPLTTTRPVINMSDDELLAIAAQGITGLAVHGQQAALEAPTPEPEPDDTDG